MLEKLKLDMTNNQIEESYKNRLLMSEELENSLKKQKEKLAL